MSLKLPGLCFTVVDLTYSTSTVEGKKGRRGVSITKRRIRKRRNESIDRERRKDKTRYKFSCQERVMYMVRGNGYLHTN